MSSPRHSSQFPSIKSTRKRKAKIIGWMSTVEDSSETESHGTEAIEEGVSTEQKKLDEVRRAVGEYNRILTDVRNQSVKSSEVRYPDPEEDSARIAHIGKLIMELKESGATSQEAKNKASGLSEDCRGISDNLRILKERNEEIESCRQLLSKANRLTRETLTKYQQGSASDCEALVNEMAAAHHHVNANSQKINDAVTCVSEVYRIHDGSSTDHRWNLEYGLDGKVEELRMQDHTLISEVEAWGESRQQIDNSKFPTELRRLLPDRYNDLLTSVETSRPEDHIKTFGTFSCPSPSFGKQELSLFAH
ncbi:hypothetical protein I302_105650 [Kwoniella bestiolae CBS 10118]|uniref:Uncharacterized protein n=1 Tax=Kwoniella bestiolae CBS 10118 TaxID=1296100 RepID=A0A1B9G1Q7_9TREE|nr:hypothetical protein I302_04767 [Kwoniella bestiolae CBS 10118]OCF24957.1 hypothetical protein I302_04767 [Kwoniella bestiolae CBS 10118]